MAVGPEILWKRQRTAQEIADELEKQIDGALSKTPFIGHYTPDAYVTVIVNVPEDQTVRNIITERYRKYGWRSVTFAMNGVSLYADEAYINSL